MRRRRRRLKVIAWASLVVAVFALLTVGFLAIGKGGTSGPTLEPYPTYTFDVPPAEPTGSPRDATSSPTADSTDSVLARIAIAGDIGTRDEHIRRTGEAVAASDAVGRPFDALVIPGDLIYSKGDSALTEASVVAPFAKTFEVNEIIPAVGNHDIESNEEGDIMRRLGRPSPTYAAKVGPVLFLVVDSNDVNSEQTKWLEQQLQASQPGVTWKIPVMHHPAYSSGKHGSDRNVQKRWSPLFVQNKVALVIAGHDHDYERSKPQSGVTYLVSGGAANLRPVGKSSFTAYSTSKYHFVDLAVYADRLVGRAVDQDGNAFDQWVIPLPGVAGPDGDRTEGTTAE